MDFKTAHRRIVPYIFILALILTGCRKEDQETVVHVRCVTPHNNQPVKGCKVIITEGKMKSGIIGVNVSFDAIQQFSGITDENGVATIKFHYKKNSKFQYQLSKDYSGITPPSGMTDLDMVLPLNWTDFLDKKQFDFFFQFNVLGSCHIHTKIENVNCFDANDKIEIDLVNTSEHYSFDGYESSYMGCGTVAEGTTYPDYPQKTGMYIYKLQITKNNQSIIRYDTFNLQPNVINDVIIQY